MSVYKPTMRHLREVLLYYFNSYESASEAHRMLVHAYGKGIISRNTCIENFKRFRSGNFNLNRRTRRRLNKERVIGELVRLTLENPRITQAEMAAEVGISQITVFRYQKSQEYQNEFKKLQQDQSSIPLKRLTSSALKRKLTVEELVRLRLENPSMTEAEIAAKLGVSVKTVYNYQSSQEYQNEIEKLQQDQSSIPLERLTSSALRRKRTVEELVRLTLENPSMTLAEMAAKVGVSVTTVWNYQKSQEYQNELKKLQQDQSSIPHEGTTLKRQHRELEEEESLNSLNEIPPITPDERRSIYEMSISETEEVINNMERQNKLKEKGLEPSSMSKKRRISRTPSKELEEEESLNSLNEIPPITPDERTNIYGMSISETEELINNMERQSKLKENELEKSCKPLERPSTSRTPRTESEYEEIVNNMDEFPHQSPDQLAGESELSISIAQTFLSCMKK